MNNILPPEPAPPAPQGKDPIEAFVLPIWRGRLLIFLSLVLGACGGLVAALMKPNLYTSVGKVLVQLGRREGQTPDTALDSGPGGSRGVSMQTEHSILSNPEIAEQVAKSVGPGRILRPYDPASALDGPSTSPLAKWLHQAQSWWFLRSYLTGQPHGEDCSCETCVQSAKECLLASRTIAPETGSSIITVSVDAISPSLAQDLTQRHLDAFLIWHIRAFTQDSSSDHYLSEAEKALAEAQRAESALTTFRKQTGINDLLTQKSQLITEVAGLEKELADNHFTLTGISSQLTYVNEKLKTEQPFIKEDAALAQIPNPDRVPVYQQLNQLKEKQRQLLTEYEAGSPQFTKRNSELAKQIAEVEKELNEMPALIDPGTATRVVPNPVHEELRKRLEDLTAKQQEVEAPTKLREQRLATKRTELEKLISNEGEIARLEREASLARTRAEQHAEALSKFEALELLDQKEISNLKISQRATYPLEKSGLDRTKILATGAVIGMMLGVGLAFLRHMLDQTLRRPQDVARVLGLRVIGVVPNTRRWRGASRLTRLS